MSHGWHAMLAAAPELVPTVRLSFVYDEDLYLQSTIDVSDNKATMPCGGCNHLCCAQLQAALGRLAGISPRALSVSLEGYDWCLVSCLLLCCVGCGRRISVPVVIWKFAAMERCSAACAPSLVTFAPHRGSSALQTGHGKTGGPNLLPEALQLLPTGLTALELNSYCTHAAAEGLARLTGLQRLRLSGNAWEVDWAQPAAQALLPQLSALRLHYCILEPPGCYGGSFNNLSTLPFDHASALMAASRLERLDIQMECWSDSISQLCEALPALRELRWVAPHSEVFVFPRSMALHQHVWYV